MVTEGYKDITTDEYNSIMNMIEEDEHGNV